MMMMKIGAVFRVSLRTRLQTIKWNIKMVRFQVLTEASMKMTALKRLLGTIYISAHATLNSSNCVYGYVLSDTYGKFFLSLLCV
jgi:hypothetical protein